MVYDEPKAPALRRLSFPHIGMRTIKTVLAAMLAALFMKYVMHQTMFFACIGAIPTLLTYLIFQNQIVGGLTQGAVKG